MPKINQEEYEKIKLLPDYDWNWIAREKTGKILSFTNKPTKTDEVWKDTQTRLWFNHKDSQLFQFIQWEDEEPYEITELIREYEIKELRLAPSGTIIVDSFDESEETVMKKDIEWLNEEIGELPVVPKHVGEWITRYREKYDLYPALRLLTNNTLVWREIYEWYRMNTHKFVNAYLTGEYEVEEEQKYYVLDSYDIPLLERVGKQIQKTATELSIHEKAGDISRFELTEQEIKSYDERFWAFAEPVE